jgi:SAM-dependent methyltransferase
MEFTGERYLPGVEGSIKYEHLHRYGAALGCVAGKRVLDIASGEGFGADMLAAVAANVIGVDISVEAVDHARTRYATRTNLRFAVGSCAAVPVADASVDVVTSFETIEHHDQHEAMLGEITRVLAPGGLLILSSPNRHVYSDVPGYRNPFHVKELYLDELLSLLRPHFCNVKIYGQRIAAGSFLTPLDVEGENTIRALSARGMAVAAAVPRLEDPAYFLAVCSDDPAQVAAPLTSVFLEERDLWCELVTGTRAELANVRDHAARVEAELGRTRAQWAQLGHELEDSRTHVRHLEWVVQKGREHTTHLEDELDKSRGHVRHLEASLLAERDHSRRLGDDLTASQNRAGRVERDLEWFEGRARHLQDDLAAAHDEIARVTAELERAAQRIAWMETSRFWKLRGRVVHARGRLRSAIDEMKARGA